jgi:hypothetical protein
MVSAASERDSFWNEFNTPRAQVSLKGTLRRPIQHRSR